MRDLSQYISEKLQTKKSACFNLILREKSIICQLKDELGAGSLVTTFLKAKELYFFERWLGRKMLEIYGIVS